jgi:SsrA-binding protein
MAEGIKIVATNRKARHDYHIEDTLEAGIVLRGTEVKSLREGRLNLTDSFCTVEKGEMIVHGLHISPYSHGNLFNHEPLRPRKLLLHRKEIERWGKATEQKGFTIVPLKVYFKNGFAKVEIGLARGKKQYDKRADISERETQRKLDRVMRGDRPE